MGGMMRKRKIHSVVFHVGACGLGFLMIYPLLWLLASSFKSNETMKKMHIPLFRKYGTRSQTIKADGRA